MTLDAYIADPQEFIKGNRMAFGGITDPAERADLIAYLEQAAKTRQAAAFLLVGGFSPGLPL